MKLMKQDYDDNDSHLKTSSMESLQEKCTEVLKDLCHLLKLEQGELGLSPELIGKDDQQPNAAALDFAQDESLPENVRIQSLNTVMSKVILQIERAPQEQIKDSVVPEILDDILKTARTEFYKVSYKDVKAGWRLVYTDASTIKASNLLLTWISEAKSIALLQDSAMLEEFVKILDMAIIMAGAGDEQRRELVDRLLQSVQTYCSRSEIVDPVSEHPPKRRRIETGNSASSSEDVFPTSDVWQPNVRFPVSRVANLPLEGFVKHMRTPSSVGIYDGPEPLVIGEAMEDWPALTLWKKPSYFLEKTMGGRRLVPIELGRSYVDEDWGQKIITFKEFMEDYLLDLPNPAKEKPYVSTMDEEPGDLEFQKASTAIDRENICIEDIEDRSTAYLAQHDLFAQISALRNDIFIPDYCWSSPPGPHHTSPLAIKHAALPALSEPQLNAWFGPAETISPLHVDPYHNILAQVIGRKYIRLYAPHESVNLYPRGRDEDLGVDMDNTSELDVGLMEGWDGTDEERREAMERWPKWKEAEYVDVVLEEGECLYIPVGWWHYVRSLSVSFSVSFWWN